MIMPLRMLHRLVFVVSLVQFARGNNFAKLEQEAQALLLKLQARCGDQNTCSAGELEQMQNAQTVLDIAAMTTPPSRDQWTQLFEAVSAVPAAAGNSKYGDVDAWMSESLSKHLSIEDLNLLTSLATGSPVEVEDTDDETEDSSFKANAEETVWNGYRLGSNSPWPDRTMVYAWHPEIIYNARRKFESGMEEIEQKTCIRFREVPDGSEEKHMVLKSDETGCFKSGNPKSGGRINLGSMCRWHGVAVHELLHGVGVAHEQKRPDRDIFLEIAWDNVAEGKESQFEFDRAAYTEGPYDYDSIMHYGRYSFSKVFLSQDLIVSWTYGKLAEKGIDTGSPTLQTRNLAFASSIGGRGGMSAGDVSQMLQMYACPKMVPSSERSSSSNYRFASFSEGLFQSSQVHIAQCPAGFLPTSCSCWEESGKCRGAILAEANSGVCSASGISSGVGEDLRAYVVCHKLPSTHYSLAPLSDAGSKSATVGCPGRYKLVGCSCLAPFEDNCGAVPDVSTSSCTATSSGDVYAQAQCARTEAISEIVMIQGEPTSSSTGQIEVSVAACPTTADTLTGCSCDGENCVGARPSGEGQNQCSAYSSGFSTVRAYALCAKLLGASEVLQPIAEHLTDTTMEADLTAFSDWIRDQSGGSFATNKAVQSIFCDIHKGRSDIEGCSGFRLKVRSKAAFDCSQYKCSSHDMVLTSEKIEFELSSSGVAECPHGWVIVDLKCKDDCQEVSVVCAPPDTTSAWFVSGQTTYTPWFSGESGAAMGSCEYGVAVGLECSPTKAADSPFGKFMDIGEKCNQIRIICRSVAIEAGDSSDQRGLIDIELHTADWSDSFSSTGAAEKFTQFDFKDESVLRSPTNLAIQKVRCESHQCDDLKVYLPTKLGTYLKSISLEGEPTIATETFKDRMECPQGHFVAGIQCKGSFCREKAFLCATPANSTWYLSGATYMTHCFTNEGKYKWNEWFREWGQKIRGRSRSCLGLSRNDMPTEQSCGIDGVVVGMQCYGDNCDRIQLLCRTVDVNVMVNEGVLSGAGPVVTKLAAAGLFTDPASWGLPTRKDGEPFLEWIWDGLKIVEGDTDNWLVSHAAHHGPYVALLLLIALFAP